MCYTIEELIGQSANIFGEPGSRHSMSLNELAHALNWRRESMNVRKDRTVFPVLLVSTAIINQENEIVGMITVCQDITALKKAASKLHQTNEELNQTLLHLQQIDQERNDLLSIVSHDLRNPLTYILGISQMVNQLEFTTFKQEELASFFRDIEEHSNQMLNMTRNLLDLNRIESGNLQLNIEPYDIRMTVANVLTRYQSTAEEKHLELRHLYPDTECLALIDTDAINQVIENLISNAIKYSPSGRKVTIRTQQKDEWIRCEIQDQGQGLTAHDKEKLFQKFTQLSARPTNNEQSIGLGLSIVKKLTEAMNGTIKVESEGRDRGATFIIEFPCA